jgi:hypothetical protein
MKPGGKMGGDKREKIRIIEPGISLGRESTAAAAGQNRASLSLAFIKRIVFD